MPSLIRNGGALEEQSQEQAEETDGEHGEVLGARVVTRGMLVRRHPPQPRPRAPLHAPRWQRTAGG